MGLKTNIALGIVAVGGLALGGGSAAFLYMEHQKPAEIDGALDAYDLTSVAGYTPDETAGDRALELSHQLSGGNTLLIWEVEKNKPNGHMEFDGTWSILTGGIVFNTDTQSLQALEVVFQTNSVVGFGAQHPAPPELTNTLIGQSSVRLPAWFDLEAHPEASFIATAFVTREQAEADGLDISDDAPDGWTHLIQGTFSLNGHDVELAIPAKAEFISEELVLTMGFALKRSDFDIDGTIVGGWVVDDTIHLHATVESAPRGDIIVDTLRAHGVALSENRATINTMRRMENQIEELNSQITALRELIANGDVVGGNSDATQVADYDLSKLPERFTDHIRYHTMRPQTYPESVARMLGFHLTYPYKSPMPFDMVRVPGDAAQGITPFYMAEYEVTWDMIYDWVYALDISVNQQAEMQLLDLWPSPLFEDCEQLKIGRGNRPAISMSRRTAEAFCKWLSEQTGRHYRLPTDAEWQLALELGGGIPSDRDSLFAMATMRDNAESQAAEVPDQYDPFADGDEDTEPLLFTTLVGSRKPNALGIYDMIGNAAEWVTDTGADRYVRGGHFRLSIDEFDADWKSVEDQDIWNETYPQKPNSRFWYRDHYYQGIRLVCDPENLPE